MSHHKITSLVMRVRGFEYRHRLHSITAGQAHTDHKTDTADQAAFQQSRQQSDDALANYVAFLGMDGLQ